MVKPLSFLARDSQFKCTQALKKYIVIKSARYQSKTGRFCFEIALRTASRFALTAVGILSNSCIAVAGDISQL